MSGNPTAAFVSLLVPFDTGQSYVFKPSSVASAESEWERAFDGFPHWGWEQFPDYFEKPLGCLARLNVRPQQPGMCSHGACTPLDDLVQAIAGLAGLSSCVPWARADTTQVQALLFPFGVGVLVVRLDLAWVTREAVRSYRKYRPDIREALSLLVAGCSDYYSFCLKTAAARHPKGAASTLIKLRGVDRTEDIKESSFLYPVFFAEEYDYDKLVEDYKAANGGAGSRCPYDRAEVYAAWTEAYAKGHSAESRLAVETSFVIALASWYTLFAMDRLALSRSQEAFVESMASRRLLKAKEIRMMRLVHMDVANASHPLRWTTREKDLLLLEKIHEVWATERLWQNVAERTSLLESHYVAFETEEDEERSSKLTRLGLLIAGIATTSVVADLIDLAQKPSAMPPAGRFEGWLSTHGFAVALAFLLLLVAVALGVWIFEKLPRRARTTSSRRAAPKGRMAPGSDSRSAISLGPTTASLQ
ncbi:MAG TPA: hypothetical protein VF756_06745 [Thermoanaerobaculia bacterium]